MIEAALTCMAMAVYFEARGEPLVGQSAVAHVILNRVEDQRYPNTICEVVKQGPTYKWKTNYPIRHKCQFSFYCDGKSDKPTDRDAYTMAKMISFGAISGRTYDPTEGATHYHAYYVNPSWAQSKHMTVRINDHIFYAWD